MEQIQSSSVEGFTFIVSKDIQPAIVCEDIQPAFECQEVVCEDIQAAIECREIDDWAKGNDLPQGGQKQADFLDDGVDLPLTTILEALPETIGDDQEKLYHELGLTIQALARKQVQSLENLLRQSATMLMQRNEFYKHRQLLEMLSSYAVELRPSLEPHDWKTQRTVYYAHVVYFLG